MSRRRGTNTFNNVQYQKLDQSDQSYLDSQFQQTSTQKIPWKAIGLATLLCFGGIFMLLVGSLIITGHLDSKYSDRMWPILIIGIIMFIPGVYHIRIALYAYKQYPGYSFDDIPEFD
ncbi:hypothetical protein RUM43_007289 [Polyplax serrata]|uniref:Transmembrane protein 230 n=1 Tax=Polyplax serrata TaxID=468196 RepID=A0AAN8S8L2_POLSC